MIRTIAHFEIQRLLRSPLLWIILAAFTGLLAYLFLSFIELFNTQISATNAGSSQPLGVTQGIATPTFLWAALLGHLILPLFAGRLLPEEHQHKTWPLLAAAPLSGWQIMWGKYLGLQFPIALLSLLPFLLSLSLLAGSPLDAGLLLWGTLGVWLSLAAFGAASLYISSLFREPLMATVFAFALLMTLVIIHMTATSNDSRATGLYELSPLKHLQPLIEGRINSADIIWFLSFGILFLWLAGRRLTHPDSRSQ